MKLYHGDCVQVIDENDLKADCIFADPPDNIGLGYQEYNDRLSDGAYVERFGQWLDQFIVAAPIVWLSFNAIWTVEVGARVARLLSENPEWECKPCVQVFTFGQHRQTDLGNNHRPLWRLKHKDAPLYPDQIRIPSWRQRNGDKRASTKGRVPGDVYDMEPLGYVGRIATCKKGRRGYITKARMTDDGWLFHGIGLDDGTPWQSIDPTLGNVGDVFDFPRVTGNSKQRCDWHPTQLHEELVERCIKLSTLEGQTVLDPFGGTGTTMRASKSTNRDCTLIEYDAGYCKHIADANGLKLTRTGLYQA